MQREIQQQLKRLGAEPRGAKFNPVRAQTIARIEELARGRLPPDYSTFLTTFGGCVFDSVSCVDQLGQELDFDQLFGEGPESIVSVFRTYKPRFPAGLIPIGADLMGNFFCLSVGERPGVYFWDHELEGDEGDQWQGFSRVSDSFLDLLRQLRKR